MEYHNKFYRNVVHNLLVIHLKHHVNYLVLKKHLQQLIIRKQMEWYHRFSKERLRVIASDYDLDFI